MYYNLHGEYYKFSDFIELEVKERKNYSLTEINNWMKKYNLTINDDVIWVNKSKDIILNDNTQTAVEISENNGFIITESYEGDAGALFVYKSHNILTKEQVVLLTENKFENLLNKYKKEFKEFFILLKKQFVYNKNARKIISTYIKTKDISKEDIKKLKTIVKDQLKLVGLGSVAMLPIPGATTLIILLIKMSKKLGIDIVQSQMKSDTVDISESNDSYENLIYLLNDDAKPILDDIYLLKK